MGMWVACLVVALAAASPAAVTGAADASAEAAPPVGDIKITWDPGAFTRGRVAVVHVHQAGGGPLPAVAARLGKHSAIAVPLGVGELVLLGAVDIDERADSLPLVVTIGTAAAPQVRTLTAPVTDGSYDERKLTVDRKFTQPNRRQRQRAAREAKELDRVLARESPARLWRGSWSKPTAGAETSPFGTKRTYNNKKVRRHLGWDLDGAIGDPVTAANAGRVVLASERYYSGGTVVLDHGQGLFTMYFHLSRIDVKVGALVARGAPLGAVGKSGQVTGPHLHFTVRFTGSSLDPKHLLGLDFSADSGDVADGNHVAPRAGLPQE